MRELKSQTGNFSADFMNVENIPAFFSAPHRVMFFAGSIQLILVLLFLSIELAGRFTSLWSSHFIPIYLKPRADGKSG